MALYPTHLVAYAIDFCYCYVVRRRAQLPPLITHCPGGRLPLDGALPAP